MPLLEEFERSGNWLFRWRSYLPLGMILLIALVLLDYQPFLQRSDFDTYWKLFCFGIGLLGLGIRVYTIGHTPRGTSGRNTAGQRAAEVNTTGIYSTVRHPLYLGNYVMGLGLALVPHQWWLVAIYSLIFWVYYERIMVAEEEFLRKKFGAAYEEWGNRTPAFIPSFKHWQPPALPFSARNVLKREYSGFFALILSMYILVFISDFAIAGKPTVNWLWIGITIFGFLVWFTLRTLKKKTRILHVEGR
ncbi:MAG: DUF1295 domain-containing protein [Ignavibacteriae bacterium]|nr:DUF1295 domain-containing protein [Ignavibacteriota bacterium]MCB9215187.1 DUF1295 domain-containing protein [Ignavibacteria bacterium]